MLARKIWTVLASFVMLAVWVGMPNSSSALTVEAMSVPSGFGEDGSNGNDGSGKRGAIHTLVLDVSELIGEVEIDYSDFGVGLGLGVDLGNISSTPGVDITMMGGTIAAITVNNTTKKVVVTFTDTVLVGSQITIVIRDVQNPHCPGTALVVAKNTGLLSDIGGDAMTFGDGRVDADGDSLPDGFEIYFSAGMVRGDEDMNPTFKNAELNPDVASDPLADQDGDGWSDRAEFLSCTNPANSMSEPAATDSDGDGIYDFEENYPGEVVDTDGTAEPDFNDTDADDDGVLDSLEAGDSDLATPPVDSDDDKVPDFQDLDSDNDTILDETDNCRRVKNPGQADNDEDNDGDVCDPDDDNDGVVDEDDNCPLQENPSQEDADNNGIGDVCDSDEDGDGVPDGTDNCPTVSNPDQKDLDDDGIGDLCDIDDDNDGVIDTVDNCPTVPNLGQSDVDGDGKGDVCDPDADDDGVLNEDDNCVLVENPEQEDTDDDGIGDACEGDIDGDGILDGDDNCPLIPNPGQENQDNDAAGDVCDIDTDDDGDNNGQDNCIDVPNPDQTDTDGDGVGDVCENLNEGNLHVQGGGCSLGDTGVLGQLSLCAWLLLLSYGKRRRQVS